LRAATFRNGPLGTNNLSGAVACGDAKTPVAMTGFILIGLGFSPLAASGLSLIANTAPVAYGALGTPIAGLASVTGLDPYVLGAMVGRQLPFFSLIVPFWLIWVFAGFRGMLQAWPAILVTGVSFAIPQAVSHLQLHQSLDRGYRRFADFDGLPHRGSPTRVRACSSPASCRVS